MTELLAMACKVCYAGIIDKTGMLCRMCYLGIFGLVFMTSIEAKALPPYVQWSKYVEDAVRIFVDKGGNAETALYAEYDLDNDGREELLIFDTGTWLSEDRHMCVFCVNQKNEMQFVVDSQMPVFCYNTDGPGSYTMNLEGKYVQLVNSTTWIDDSGQYGDGDNLCLIFHGRRSLRNFDRFGKPLNMLREKDLDMSPCKDEVNVANVSNYWYRTKPKVKGQMGVVAFFNAICDAIGLPELRDAQRVVNGEKSDVLSCTLDNAAQYIQVKKRRWTDEEDDKEEDRIECTMWKRDDGRHIVALNYSIYEKNVFYGEFVNLLFWEYDAATSSLVPITEPLERSWSIPNLSYAIDIELPRRGKDIRVTDHDTGNQYYIRYQHDEDLITFWADDFYENTMLSCCKGLVCSIYDTTDTDTNIRLAPKGKVSEYKLGKSRKNLVVGEQKDGYYRIIDNEIEYPDDDCDNMLFMDDNATGYWIHRSCLALMSRHNNGEPLMLLKKWDDCDKQPAVYTIKTPTLLRPMEYAEREGWVKVQTLDGKHTGWVTKDRLSTIRPT